MYDDISWNDPLLWKLLSFQSYYASVRVRTNVYVTGIKTNARRVKEFINSDEKPQKNLLVPDIILLHSIV